MIRLMTALLMLCVVADVASSAQTLTALTTTNPVTISLDGQGNPLIFSGIPNPLVLPSGAVAYGIPSAPWPSPDGRFKLVSVSLFAPPNGQITTGAPSYAIDGQGNVSQTFSTISAVPSNALAQYTTAITAGIAVTSTGTPALNATYAIDPATMQSLYNLSNYIAVNGVYPGGNATLNWPDITGTTHTFGITSTFKAFAKALQDYVAKAQVAQAQQAAGGSPTWPTASATIP